MNADLLKKRSLIIKMIRRFFDERGYTEMHTPRLTGLPGQEPYLEPFWTEVFEENRTRHPAALITSPEYAMKRLLAAGLDKIYDLGPCFRNNEPWDGTHDPEFLMIEWYRKNGDLASLMDETEEMVRSVAKEVESGLPPEASAKGGIMNHESGILTEKTFRRLTCAEAWKLYAGVDLEPLIGNRDAMESVAREQGQTVSALDMWDDLYYKVFLTKIEPKLGEAPTFLYRYPVSMAALARRCNDDARFADRVELYIGGMELANGFAELTDADEQRLRFLEDRDLRQRLGKKTWALDEAFLSALPKIGDAVGIAFGIDRFVMLLTGAKSINDVVPFPARDRFIS
jgi:elongation factor P--(R)-beta-lysine ligase